MINKNFLFIFFFFLYFFSCKHSSSTGLLKVSSQNSRYLTNNSGEAIYLTGSHTWANRQERGIEGKTPDFDFKEYLKYLKRYDHNFIRLWLWEHAQWMQFESSATPVRYRPLPYIRTGPGLAKDGKPKFDLARFNQEYFKRLKIRVQMAQNSSLYVGIMFFQGFSLSKNRGDQSKGNAWQGHPYHLENNINNINGNPSGDDTGFEVHTLQIPEIIKLQENYIKKVIDTLNDFDNIVWEISNESHSQSVEWQYYMIRFVREYEKTKTKQHLIGMTGSPIQNEQLYGSPADWISPVGKIFLTDPPIADGRKIIIVDTDHISPWSCDPEWIWKNFFRGNHFIMMDSYLDYRIHSPLIPDSSLDGARVAMGNVRKLSEKINLNHFLPTRDICTTGYALVNPNLEYYFYIPKNFSEKISLNLKEGKYKISQIDPETLDIISRTKIDIIENEIQHKFDRKTALILHFTKI
jgi:hypothetical protein